MLFIKNVCAFILPHPGAYNVKKVMILFWTLIILFCFLHFQVPIVKLTDLETDVKVDISFKIDHNGVESAKLILVSI